MTTAKNKEIVRKVNDTFTVGDVEGFLSYCTDDIQWNMVGQPALSGIDTLRKEMTHMGDVGLPELTISKLIAEGDMVVCEGTMKMMQPDGKPFDGMYCDIYRFRDGKIVELSSYVINTVAETAAS